MFVIRGDIDVRRARLKHGHYSEPTVVHKNSTREVEEMFEYIAVLDFEATCEQNQSNFLNEIIEFPIVLINVREQTIVDIILHACQRLNRSIV